MCLCLVLCFLREGKDESGCRVSLSIMLANLRGPKNPCVECDKDMAEFMKEMGQKWCGRKERKKCPKK